MASITKVQPLIRCTQTARRAGPALTHTLRAEFSEASGLNYVSQPAPGGQAGEATPIIVPRTFVPPIVSYDAWHAQRVAVRDLASPFGPRVPRQEDAKVKDEAAERMRELKAQYPPRQ